MTAAILDGKKLALSLKSEMQSHAGNFQSKHGYLPSLALVSVGIHHASQIYRRQIEHSCSEIGLACSIHTFPYSAQEGTVRESLAALNAREDVHGIVILLPLPEHVQQRTITEVLSPEKDVDGLGPRNAGNMMLGFPSFIPSTADATLFILEHYQIPIHGKSVVIVGRGNTGGKPIGLQLLHKNATITFCHSKTRNLTEITRSADILCISIGLPKFITGPMVKPGAVVIDAGINELDGQIAGDIDFESVQHVAGWITPVPGGIGPLTHLMLIRHTLLGPR